MKKILYILVSILIIGCSNLNINPSTGNNINEECRIWAESLVPETFRVYESPSGQGLKFEDDNLWNDGIKVTAPVSLGLIEFKKGSKEGENINYYYPSYITTIRTENPLQYNKQIIDYEGNILGNNHFGAKPVLKIRPDSEGLRKQFSDDSGATLRTLEMEIVEPNIIECKKKG